MADTKVTDLTALGAEPASGDQLMVVDVSDPTMNASGTNKKLSYSVLSALWALATHNHAASEITSGQLVLERGGSEADLSATGPGAVVQASSGAAFTTETLDETRGGTGQNTVGTGEIIYGSAPNVFSKLAVGSDTEVLTLASGIPSWAAASGSSLWSKYPGIAEVTNSTAETTCFTHSLSAMGANDSAYVVFYLEIDQDTGAADITVNIKLGATTVLSPEVTSTAAATTHMIFHLFMSNLNSTSAQSAVLCWDQKIGAISQTTVLTGIPEKSANESAEDTSTSKNLVVTVQAASADATGNYAFNGALVGENIA